MRPAPYQAIAPTVSFRLSAYLNYTPALSGLASMACSTKDLPFDEAGQVSHYVLENAPPKKRRAVEALLDEPDVSYAAKAAGVSRNTLYRCIEEQDFMVALALLELVFFDEPFAY